LWTKAVGSPGYVKSEWAELNRSIVKFCYGGSAHSPVVIVPRAGISSQDLEEMAHVLNMACRDASFFPIIPADLMDQVELVVVKDEDEAVDAVLLLQKMVNAGALTPDTASELERDLLRRFGGPRD